MELIIIRNFINLISVNTGGLPTKEQTDNFTEVNQLIIALGELRDAPRNNKKDSKPYTWGFPGDFMKVILI